ncbi:aspartate-semialdehyde dehydrogenase [Waddlia chondrophila]|uniref:aspartate-semialdehyde dehydrogenase n=1 Tax=Waddlia chondrophila (strain ATCC VR-1470 / WSU 86-1044) TaxID=716544 RepID=D6YW22_WADCW|nr:aspartate-semialdehyde dehydrogenase [Waddlia chondrophila]ADI38333.1 Aspartate-semialdehyde dehydrogenase [Waddlia chondrophila WSU 86-1044]
MKRKIPVAILGATGSVGQSFVRLLKDHPWFYIAELVASKRSAGKKFGDFVPNTHLEDHFIKAVSDSLSSKIVFSALDAQVAGEIESSLARKGHWVISNCRNHRYDPDVPLLIPEVNPEQLHWIKRQQFGGGVIVTNPNCSVIGLALTLKPLVEAFGVEQVHVVTLQAVSGAGFRARTILDIDDNVIPYISGEEEKIEKELDKILCIKRVSAQCNRVSVSDGHTQCVSVKLSQTASLEEIKSAWTAFRSPVLPSSPSKPIHYFNEESYPQPKLHRMLEKGMAVSVGRLRKCSLFDIKYATLSHNTIRGAAGCAIMNAELLIDHHYNGDIVGASSLIGQCP